MPEGKLSYEVEDYMFQNIDDKYAGTENYCTLAQAQSWGNEILLDKDGKPSRTRNPDLHSHSWLTLDELKQALTHYRLGENAPEIDVPEEDRAAVTRAVAALLGGGSNYSPAWDAVVAVMATYEARGCQTRLVFCFGN